MPNLLDILRPALDFVLPERCPCCGVITPPGGNFCADCWQQLHFITPPWCAGCGMPIGGGPLGFASDDEKYCASCLAIAPQHDGIRAAVAYSDISRQVVLRLKYRGKIGMAKLVAAHLVRHLPEGSGEYLVVPVPLHWTRLWNRGFNQSALIAKALVVKAMMAETESNREVADICAGFAGPQQAHAAAQGLFWQAKAKTRFRRICCKPKMAIPLEWRSYIAD